MFIFEICRVLLCVNGGEDRTNLRRGLEGKSDFVVTLRPRKEKTCHKFDETRRKVYFFVVDL